MLSRRRLLALDPPEVGGDAYWARVSRPAMACSFEAVVDPCEERSVLAARAFLDEVDRLESVLSIFRPQSELSRVNREAAGQPTAVGPDLRDLLRAALDISKETAGAFDVTAGALSECWGFEARRPSVPTPEALTAARARVGFEHVQLGPEGTVAFGVPGLKINLGGIGKGYALDRGAESFRRLSVAGALLSAGHSSVLALGHAGDSGWPIALRHPTRKDRHVATVRLESCALATSGAEEQFFEHDGRRFGHILDPRTGLPAGEVATVSVIADGATQAEALATAFFAGGRDLAQGYCARHTDVLAVLLLSSDLERPLVFGSHPRAVLEVVHG